MQIRTEEKFKGIRANKSCAYSVSGIGWFTCREQFHASLRKDTAKIYFSTYSVPSTIKILKYVEKKLNQEFKITVFKHSDVIQIENIEFWMKSSLRKHFLTAILRCGSQWNRKFTINQNLSGFFKNTAPAARKFLNGYTVYSGKFYGWFNSFNCREIWNRSIGFKKIFPVNGNLHKLIKEQNEPDIQK